METLEQLKKSIGATRDLQSIVRTMKVLAGVSIRQYERALASLADYEQAIAMGMHVVLGDTKEFTPQRRRGQPRRLGVVLFGSDQALCGRFNDVVADFAVHTMERFHIPAHNRELLAIGSRARSALEHRGQRVRACMPVPGSAAAITGRVRSILLMIEQWRSLGEITDVVLFYNGYRPDSSRGPSLVHLIPVRTERFEPYHQSLWPSRSLPTYTLPRTALLASLVRQYLLVSVFRACAESLASEHASRLESMQLAEKNIEGHLGELDASYRHRRQEAITVELLDVVAGYEAQMSMP